MATNDKIKHFTNLYTKGDCGLRVTAVMESGDEVNAELHIGDLEERLLGVETVTLDELIAELRQYVIEEVAEWQQENNG